jgi:hypothetical protein
MLPDCRIVKCRLQIPHLVILKRGSACALLAVLITLWSSFLTNALAVSYPSLDLSNPVLLDMNGILVEQVQVGQQVMIIGAVNNTVYNTDKPMVALVEVRDTYGVTIFLAYQSMIIGYNENYTFGVSWMPDPSQITDIGTYSIRVWTLTCICESAEPLSSVFGTEIEVT